MGRGGNPSVAQAKIGMLHSKNSNLSFPSSMSELPSNERCVSTKARVVSDTKLAMLMNRETRPLGPQPQRSRQRHNCEVPRVGRRRDGCEGLAAGQRICGSAPSSEQRVGARPHYWVAGQADSMHTALSLIFASHCLTLPHQPLPHAMPAVRPTPKRSHSRDCQIDCS